MYRSFTGEALLMLRGGMMEEEITALMMKRYVVVQQDNTEQNSKAQVISKKEGTEYKVIDAKQSGKCSKVGITSSKRLPGKAYYTILFGEICSNKASPIGFVCTSVPGPRLYVQQASKLLVNYFDDLSPAKPQFAFSWY